MSDEILLPAYGAERLAALDERQLITLMIGDEDRVPRNVIDECVRRGAAMEDALRPVVAEAVGRGEDGENLGQWWLRLHAVMILGEMNSVAAGELLLGLMIRMDLEDDENLQEWVAGYWPALYANKPSQTIDGLANVVQDRRLSPWMRSEAAEARVLWLQQRGDEQYGHALAWLAQMAGDDAEDMDFRLMLGSALLDHPRPEHRPLLDRLAAIQPSKFGYFKESDVERAYSGASDPSWRDRFREPLRFYAPEEIEARQQRWREEDERDARRGAGTWLDDAEFVDDDDYDYVATYVRETPKVGRNDPCPCGSGKKYKKCCLAAGEGRA